MIAAENSKKDIQKLRNNLRKQTCKNMLTVVYKESKIIKHDNNSILSLTLMGVE